MLFLIIDPEEDGSEVWSTEFENDNSSGTEDVDIGSPPDECRPPNDNPDVSKQNALATWLTMIVLLLYTKFHLTNRIVSHLFSILKVFLLVVGRFCSFCLGIAKAFPKTLYLAKK